MRRALFILIFIGGCAHETHKAPPGGETKEEAEGEKGTAPPTEQPTTVQTPSGVQVAPTTNPTGPAPKPLPPKIKIIVRAKGPDKAIVFWGKKKLGETPVTLERPRDSGPVDLVVRGEGFFPVHTRAYTFRNDVIYVRMTKLDDRMTLFGAKRDPNEPAQGSGVPDGGAPPLPSPGTPPPQ